MTTINRLIISIATFAIVISGTSFAQDIENQPLYVKVDCMKSTSADYNSVELEIWQAMHQELVNKGEQNSWALYWVMYGDRSRCDIESALQSLSPAFAEVIDLVDVNGLTYAEAAEVLDVPVGTVMSRLHRGRKKIREHLRQSGVAPTYQDLETGRSR